MVAAALAVTPAFSGHAAAGPDAALGVVVGVLHFSAAAVWFGGLVLLGTCMLPSADIGLPQAVPRFSSVAFTAMVVIVVTGVVQSWRQVGSLQALGDTAYGRLLVAEVVAFLLLIAVAGRSRVLVRRSLWQGHWSALQLQTEMNGGRRVLSGATTPTPARCGCCVGWSSPR